MSNRPSYVTYKDSLFHPITQTKVGVLTAHFLRLVDLKPGHVKILEALAASKTRLKKMELVSAMNRLTADAPCGATVRVYAPNSWNGG